MEKEEKLFETILQTNFFARYKDNMLYYDHNQEYVFD